MTSRRLLPHVGLIGALGVVTLAAVVMISTPAHAQCAPGGDTAAAIAAASSVFVGEVSQVDTDDRIAVMQVLAVWKGRDLPAVVEVRGTTSKDAPPSSSDRRFEAAVRYLVVAENARSPFLATACSATQRYTGSPQLIPQPLQKAAGAETGRAPLGASPVDVEAAVTRSILPMLGAIVLIAFGWIAIVWLRSKAPERAKEPEPEEDPKPSRVRVRRRSFARDSKRSRTAATRLVKQNRRRWRLRRAKQDRQLAGSSTTANGSTETS